MQSHDFSLASELRPITGSDRDYDDLMQQIGDASLVLIGEASHGTHEFYAERARLTRRLIIEKGFHAVAVGFVRHGPDVRGRGGQAVDGVAPPCPRLRAARRVHRTG